MPPPLELNLIDLMPGSTVVQCYLGFFCMLDAAPSTTAARHDSHVPLEGLVFCLLCLLCFTAVIWKRFSYQH